jgi:hypothetical protein
LGGAGRRRDGGDGGVSERCVFCASVAATHRDGGGSADGANGCIRLVFTSSCAWRRERARRPRSKKRGRAPATGQGDGQAESQPQAGGPRRRAPATPSLSRDDPPAARAARSQLCALALRLGRHASGRKTPGRGGRGGRQSRPRWGAEEAPSSPKNSSLGKLTRARDLNECVSGQGPFAGVRRKGALPQTKTSELYCGWESRWRF